MYCSNRVKCFRHLFTILFVGIFASDCEYLFWSYCAMYSWSFIASVSYENVDFKNRCGVFVTIFLKLSYFIIESDF